MYNIITTIKTEDFIIKTKPELEECLIILNHKQKLGGIVPSIIAGIIFMMGPVVLGVALSNTINRTTGITLGSIMIAAGILMMFVGFVITARFSAEKEYVMSLLDLLYMHDDPDYKTNLKMGLLSTRIQLKFLEHITALHVCFDSTCKIETDAIIEYKQYLKKRDEEKKAEKLRKLRGFEE